VQTRGSSGGIRGARFFALHVLVSFLVCDLTMKSFDDRAVALFRKTE